MLLTINIPQALAPEQPKRVEKPDRVAKRDFETIEIVEDDKITAALVTSDDLKDKAISNANDDGAPLQDFSNPGS
jgi:hypothetical protein